MRRMEQVLHAVFEPGFFSNGPVHVALGLGAVIASVSALVGVFTVIRGQSFGGHALTDVSTAGGSGALLVGMTPLAGFVLGGIVGAGAIDLVASRGARDRDLATGVVLGVATGAAALFLYLDATVTATSGATQQILFGSIFVVGASTVPYVAGFAVAALLLVAVLYRPLLLSSLNADIAGARGVPVRVVGAFYMLALALAVGLSSIAVGTVLSTALLVGPAATALRLTRRMASTIVVAAAIGVMATWLGVLLSYDSYYWGSSGNGWPVSFFVVSLVFVAYLASGLPVARVLSGRRPGPAEGR